MPEVYALLVGINDYPAGVSKLNGCLNDVDNFRGYLKESFEDKLHDVVLRDGDATRANIIAQFRSHLGKAKAGDVAVFQYCGHGARSTSAPEFKEFFPIGKDEGLVCIDSRVDGGFDLADKELAVLIHEVARENPHIAIILDCCHSGSATRSVDSFEDAASRMTSEVYSPRPLESYLDGYYTDLQKQALPFSIPKARHVLLAACQRTQTAKEKLDTETKVKRGVFTTTLVEVLKKSKLEEEAKKSSRALSYADLFVRTRAAVRTRADDQNPQFEAYDDFNAQSGFLGRAASNETLRYSVYFENGKWQADCGAIQGMPTDPSKLVALALYPEADQNRAAGNASMVKVGPHKSDLQLGFESDPAVRYRAEVTSLPVEPLVVGYTSPVPGEAALAAALMKDRSVPVALVEGAAGADYILAADGPNLVLRHRDMKGFIQGVEADDAGALLPALKHVAQWERSRALANPATAFDQSLVDFALTATLGDGTTRRFDGGDAVLDFQKIGNDFPKIRAKLQARNRTDQTLYMTLLYFSGRFGVRVLSNEPVIAGETWNTLWGDEAKNAFYVPEGSNEEIDIFKLIVSSEKVDDFLLVQKNLALGAITRSTRAIDDDDDPPAKKILENEWFTKDMRVKTIRRLNQVGAADVALPNGTIRVKGHPGFTADLSMAAAKSTTRSTSEPDFFRAFERQNLELVDFAGTRGAAENVLELTNIHNAAALKDNPLQIELDVPLEAGAGLLPLIFDGEHILLAGDSWRDEAGTTHLSIDHIPEMTGSAVDTRSLGGSLKLYFFKTYLGKTDVNRLRRVDYDADGGVAYRDDVSKAKVAAAKNILLLVHGIIGDTEDMARGVKACGLDARFDLVLTFDYENLKTPIEETARDLKEKLEAVEIAGKPLTMLAHSMGGLVSRWFIERQGGNALVDHLVMCGTPNHGSPFGRIDDARKILKVLTGLSITYMPAAVPFSSALMFLLNRSKNVTPTLEQMNPKSAFITELNKSPDPGIRYTILAGDVEKYRADGDPFLARSLAKIGQGALFGTLFGTPNDIAVGVDSITGLGTPRTLAPDRRDVACHHLNYFASPVGQEALKAVIW